MKLIDLSFDGRIKGFCATATCSYAWYLDATAGSENNLTIQRDIIKDQRAYKTLREDLKRGCILPPLVLAISDVALPTEMLTDALPPSELDRVMEKLQTELKKKRPSGTYIIDGLQRTNALRQTLFELSAHDSDQRAFLARPLRIEIWINISFAAIAYRMLLLNAGQKPMSMKHQVDVLSGKLKEDLGSIDGIDILTTMDARRRVHAGQFHLGKLSLAFQAWLQGSPNVDIRNTAMEQLLTDSAMDTLGTSLSGKGADDEFKALISWMVDVDKHIYDRDPHFCGNETIMLGLAAAVGAAQRNSSIVERMKRGLKRIKSELAVDNSDILATNRFHELRQGEDVRKVNVGQFTRDMVFRAFQEYFLADGTKTMDECWAFGAAQS